MLVARKSRKGITMNSSGLHTNHSHYAGISNMQLYTQALRKGCRNIVSRVIVTIQQERNRYSRNKAFCGIHFNLRMLFVKVPSSAPDSCFQITLCGSRLNTFTIISSLYFGIDDVLISEPKLNNITPC